MKWTAEHKREYLREYQQRPEVKEHQREYQQRPEVKERQRERQQRPEVKEYQREYQQRPEVKEHQREYQREYKREYQQRPEVKERQRERQQKRQQGDYFNWDDMAEMIREQGEVDITTLTQTQQKTFKNAAEKGIIQLHDNIATKTPLTHALDGYVQEDTP